MTYHEGGLASGTTSPSVVPQKMTSGDGMLPPEEFSQPTPSSWVGPSKSGNQE